MKRIILMSIMAIWVFGFSEANAQKVIKTSDGKVYIDVQDMPAGSWSATSLISSETLITSTGNTVYKRFEVDKSNISESFTYNQAQTGCTAKGAGWRTPTQRELLLIMTMRDMLNMAGISIPNGEYWSRSINADRNSGWLMNISNGVGHYRAGTDWPIKVRCIREV